MLYDATCIPRDETQAETQLSTADQLNEEIDGRAYAGGGAKLDGFIAVMFGFLLQWPTLLTLVMFPVLVVMYVRLARIEER